MTAMRGVGTAEVTVRSDGRAGDASYRTSIADVVAFGRGEGCGLRIGVGDPEVPAVAGWLVPAHGRVFVEAAPGVHRALQVSSAGGPPVPVPAGAAFAPAASSYTVQVLGGVDTWELAVSGARRHDSTIHRGAEVVIDLTDDELSILRAYAGPVVAGRTEPATHDEVAAAVHMSRSQVRRRLDRIERHFSDLHLWLPDVDDRRVRVVEAARHNGVLEQP